MQVNAGIVPMKSMYFESGSKRLEPEEEYSGVYGNFSIVKWSYIIPFCGDYFSRSRQYTSSILAPSQSKIVVDVAAYSKISRQECLH